ncbi:MAG: tetratricopeptide repeat protein [Anaerolineae bacterium]|nr:tetratricopeptide repeat protein [Anaerolineae bacterium]
MAGNREAYQQYMETGNSAVWDQNWQGAIKAYTQAVREFQEDPEAHISLGLALLRSGRLEESFKVYTRAHQLAPDDAVPLEKSADILERMGRLKEAAQQYIKVSDVYLGQRDLDKAIGNWERATQLTPGLVTIHAKLAQAYERVGDKRKAIREYLTLAFNFRRMNDLDKAIKSVERALRLDKRNPQALNILRALRSGGEVILPEDDEKPNQKPRQSLDDDFSFNISQSEREKVGESHPLGPIGEAMGFALGALAANVIESGMLDAAGGDAMQAMEYQRQDRYADAIAAYQRAEPKMRHPALKLNLGALLLLNDQPGDAIKHLAEAMIDERLAAGAMHALGQAYFKTGKQKQAARYLIQSLQAVDSSLAVNDSEEAELESVYERLFTALEDATDEAMSAINGRFLKLLSGKDWKQRVAETRRHLDEIMRTGGSGGARDFLTASGSDELTESVSRIDRYIRQGLFTLAMDEAHRAVEVSPFYLPVHVRMAEVMMREGRVRQAINKYNAVAKSYLVRDEKERAASILTEVLETAPLDISVRTSLIELLEGEERWSETLEQYVELARTYNQLGNFDMSRETLNIAERLGKKIGASAEKMVLIKHQIAEMDQLRADIRRAQKGYEEIIEIAPGDEKAYRALVDIYYSQGNQVEATRRLDQLLDIYAKSRQINKILQMLEELVKQYQKDMGLRSRLAGIYGRLGRSKEAIAQYDSLGELQLEAGMMKDACNTIKQIVRLKPDNPEDYRKLLVQLGC